jgi:hypothetical protein
MHTGFLAGLVLALAVGVSRPAVADTASDIQSIRAEMSALRASYEARLQALEARLKSAEVALPPAAAASGARVAAAAAPTPAAAAAPAMAAPAPPSSNAFNPALSLILSGTYARTSRDPSEYAITGFALPADAEAGPGSRSFSLGESELALSANIDPSWRGAAHIALGGDDSVSVEEAYVQTTALGQGLTLKAGRFFSGIGYHNAQHAHAWDFIDAPLAYQALLGGQFGDDGLQLNWVAPTDQYVELGLEVGRGRGFPGSDHAGNGAGRWSLALHTGGDVGSSHSWRAGVSLLRAKARDQGLTSLDASGSMIDSLFNGRSRVTVLDAVWKWAPNGNATRTHFKLQAEWLRSARDGVLTHDTGGVNVEDTFRVAQSGAYVQGIYQFMPRWRVGLRTEWLDPGTPEFGANSALLDAAGYRPRKHTLLGSYSFSEFARIRLQWARDRSRAGLADNQLMLQYQMSLGAHGAHGF